MSPFVHFPNVFCRLRQRLPICLMHKIPAVLTPSAQHSLEPAGIADFMHPTKLLKCRRESVVLVYITEIFELFGETERLLVMDLQVEIEVAT